MHGDKSQSQRERALARFERGEVMTLVATDVAARGIDVANVTRVINFDAPEDRDAYVHRIGRTGRAGQTGTGISFVLADQAVEMHKIATGLGLANEFGAAPRGAGRPAHNGGGGGNRSGGGQGQQRRRRRRRGPRKAAA